MSNFLSNTPAYHPPLSPSRLPATNADNAFSRLRAARQYQDMPPLNINEQEEMEEDDEPSPVSSMSTAPPIPPPHRDAHGRYWAAQDPIQRYSTRTNSVTTPGADNFSNQAAAGGIADVAFGIAGANARESGVEAMRSIQNPSTDFEQRGVELQQYPDSMPYRRPHIEEGSSQSSIMLPLGAAAAPIASPSQSQSFLSAYSDSPYNRRSHNFSGFEGYEIDPSTIEDDGDDGLEYPSNRGSRRGSMLSLGQYSNADKAAGITTAAGLVGGTAAAPTSNLRSAQTSSEYAAVPAVDGAAANPRQTLSDMEWAVEKKEWERKERRDNKKRMWIAIVLIALLIIGGVIGGVAGGILGDRKGPAPPGTGNAATDQTVNGNLGSESAQIQALLNNAALHKVFPGIDYTPINTQYPQCLTSPPSQNNVTRDVAVLSQLTNVIRLYGTDCNQTEMVLEAIDALNLKNTVKVWLGVWQANNDTTNTRQLDQMYTILDTYDSSSFEGIIIGNEVLFRQDMTATELGDLITSVRTNLTSKGITLPLATSDLGDALSKAPALAETVDYVMSNIHPFFAGVPADAAADWTINFWNEFDVPLSTAATKHPKNIISETGWPSAGGMDCGGAKSCTNGSVAGIPEMNTFLDTFVCQALANGTTYFWFEAFDEPWKIIYDTPGEDWEDKWGLMDVNRNLKKGVVIPNCNGLTVDS